MSEAGHDCIRVDLPLDLPSNLSLRTEVSMLISCYCLMVRKILEPCKGSNLTVKP